MTTTTPINALPSPDDSSPNDPPVHFIALANQLDSRLVPRFTSTAARDSAIPTPTAGQVCWVGSREYAYTSAGWEAQARYRGNGTTFPADAIEGDVYYHSTYRCRLACRNGFWRQQDNALASSNADRASYLSGLSTAGLTLHDGFMVYQSDIDALFLADGTASNTLNRTPGRATKIASTNSTGASGLLTAGAVHQATSLSIPAHTAGRLHIRCSALWSAASNSAGTFTLQTPSGTDIDGSQVRSLNSSQANTPISVTLDAYYWSDGSGRTIYLGVGPEASAASMTVLDSAFTVWQV